MRRISVMAATALIVLVSVSVFAQTTDPEFQKARKARADAIRTGDQATFDRYTTENFTATGPSGAIENRAQRVARATRAIPDNGSALEEEKISPYGDTIVLTWRQGMNRFLEVWVKDKGVWKVAAVQLTPIKP